MNIFYDTKPNMKPAYIVWKLMQYDPEQWLATEIKHCIGVTRDMDVTCIIIYVPYTCMAIPYL